MIRYRITGMIKMNNKRQIDRIILKVGQPLLSEWLSKVARPMKQANDKLMYPSIIILMTVL
jgi:hypothetical protein